MLPNVVSVAQTGPYRLRLRFDDGVEGEVDVQAMIKFEGVFAPLRGPEFFSQVRVDAEAGTIVWPNGADVDPLVLHSRVTGKPIVLDNPSRRAGWRRGAGRRPVRTRDYSGAQPSPFRTTATLPRVRNDLYVGSQPSKNSSSRTRSPQTAGTGCLSTRRSSWATRGQLDARGPRYHNRPIDIGGCDGPNGGLARGRRQALAR